MLKNKRTFSNERRNYFRIDDVSLLKIDVVDAEEQLIQREVRYQQRKKRLTLKAKLENITREMQPLHKMIAARNSKVAKYLGMLDKKMDLLGDCLVSNELAEMDIEPEEVNLSAGGISFYSSSPIMIASLLEIELVLLPENNIIFSYAKVVSCNKINKLKNQYKVAVEFVDMNDDVRDLISHHVIKKEIDGVVASVKGSE